MFSSSRSFILTVLSLSAAFGAAPALAAPHPHGNEPPHGITHSHINRANRTTFALAPRAFENSRFTFYDAGENACGSVDDANAYIMALSPAFFNNGQHCFQKVTIDYQGKKVQATVTDECPGCSDSQADLSRPLFAALAPLDEGVIYGSWWFN
ncbi:Papain inhibitor [Trametes pubescens]|uniref:Papain inhibitor n=1 Tax=Trametes pubescens TaxID=154538 RepID=A0A1M2VMR0_TRAPU|nr:Papain inhibitor [Trametes pubescens]